MSFRNIPNGELNRRLQLTETKGVLCRVPLFVLRLSARALQFLLWIDYP